MFAFGSKLPNLDWVSATMKEHEKELAAIPAKERAMVQRFQGEGGGTPEAVREALGNYADIHSAEWDQVRLKDTESPLGNTASAQSAEVGREYMKAGEIKVTPDTQPVGDLDNPAQRIMVLKQLTQEGQSGNPTDLAECAPTSLIAGALLAGGTKGLDTIMSATMSHCSPEHQEELEKQQEAIRKAMKDGKLNFGHLQELEKQLYTVMQRDMEHQDPNVIKDYVADQKNEDKKEAANKTGGINTDTVHDFLATSPDLKDMFAKQGMKVAFVDPDGDGDGNHYVLNINDASGKRMAVFDPAARHGGQVVTSQRMLDNYFAAQQMAISGD